MLTLEDARAILHLAYDFDEYTGQKVVGIPKVIVKLFAMFPELINEYQPPYIQRIVGLTK